MSISSPFIRRPIATSLMVAAIFLAGAAAYPFLPVSPLPAVEFPTISVTGSYPGASPATMATPLETQFGQIPGLAQMTSVNVMGNSQITLQFDLSRSIDAAAVDVLEAINAAGRHVLLLVFKQAGANVINTVDAIRARLPQLVRSVPADVKVDIVSDRTQTIRASVSDVEFMLGLSHRARDRGDLRVPAQRLGDGDPERHHPHRARRHAGRHVPVRVQPRQPQPDGPYHRGRLRGRRRPRHAGEHRPPRRGRAVADGRGAERRGRDRLHHRQHQPDRGVHPAAADGRHRRTAVPRVRGDGVHHHRRVRHGVPHVHAHDGVAFPVSREA